MNKILYKLKDGKPSFSIDGKDIENPELLDSFYFRELMIDGDLYKIPDSLEFKEGYIEFYQGKLLKRQPIITLYPKTEHESQDELFRQVIDTFNRQHKLFGRPDYQELKYKFTVKRNN